MKPQEKMNPANDFSNRVLTESEQILNGLIVLCRNGYHGVRTGSGYLVSGGALMRKDHLLMESFNWHFCKNLGRWEFSVFTADGPQEPRNAGGDGEPA